MEFAKTLGSSSAEEPPNQEHFGSETTRTTPTVTCPLQKTDNARLCRWDSDLPAKNMYHRFCFEKFDKRDTNNCK